MARLKFQERHFEGIAKILSLSDESFQELVTGLAKLPVIIDPKDPVTRTISRVRNIPSDNVESVTGVLLSLFVNRASSGQNILDYVNEITQSIEESGSEVLKLSKESKEILKSRCAKILDIKSLTVSIKATTLQIEHERTFGKARVSTDIRPVFDDKADNPPDAVVLVHTLCIHYRESQGEHKEFYIAMDDEDVQVLLDVLERARVKAKSLKQTLTSAKIMCVDKS